MHPPKPPATLTGCGQALKHSTAPSPRKQCSGSRNAHTHFHITRSQLGNSLGYNCGAQHSTRLPCSTGARPGTSSQSLEKAASPTPGERPQRLPGCLVGSQAAAGRMPDLAILTVCLNDSGFLLSSPIPKNDKSAIFYSLSHTVSVQKQAVEKDTIHNRESREHQYRRQALEPCSFKSSAHTRSFHSPLLSL